MMEPDDHEFAYVVNGATHQVLPTRGVPVPFENDHFEGSVFFAHKPTASNSKDHLHAELLDRVGSPWELQIQGRFKRRPRGEIFCGADLTDGALAAGPIIRSACRVMLKV